MLVDDVVVMHGVAIAEFPCGDTIEGCKIRFDTRADARWDYNRWQVTCPHSDTVHKSTDGRPCATWRNTGALQCAHFGKAEVYAYFGLVGTST